MANEQSLDPTINRPTSAVPQEWTTKFMAANPGAQESDAVKSFMLLPADQQRSWSQPAPTSTLQDNPFMAAIDKLRNPQSFGDVFHGATGAATEGLTTALSAPYLAQHRVMQALGIIPKDQAPDVSGERGIARAIVPQTGGQGAAGMVNAAPLPWWAKIPLAAGAGYLGSKATGEEGARPAIDAVVGGAATPLAATIKGVTGAVGRFAGFGTGAAAARGLSEDAAGNLAEAIKKDVPEMGAAMSGKGSVPQQLLDLQRTGPKALSTMMESTENQVAAGLPNATVQIPQAAPTTTTGLQPGQTPLMAKLGIPGPGQAAPSVKSVSLKVAFSELQDLKDEAYYLKTQRDRGTLGNLADFKSAMDRVNALQQNIENALAADPKMLAAWRGAVAKYDYGKRYLDLANSALAGEDAAGTPFNIGSMVKAYLQDVKSFGRLPSEAKLFGGGELGTQPETTHVGVPFIGHMPTGVPGLNIYGRGPGLSFVTQPGRSYGVNVPPAVLPNALMSLGDLGRGTMEAGR